MGKQEDARDSERKRLFVLTFPPTLNANYGGILQAWALQRALTTMGYEVVTSSTWPPGVRGQTWSARAFRRLKGFIRNAVVGGLPTRWVPAAWTLAAADVDRRKELLRFSGERIQTGPLPTRGRRCGRAWLDQFDAFVAGSDQVWRAAYGDVRAYLFDFLASDDLRPRLSYAASFGVDNIDDYDEALLRDSAELAQRLTAVSVRERSGLDIARKHWGVVAEQHVDPTFLVDAAEYARLARGAEDGLPRGLLLDYVLDHSVPTRAIISDVSALIGMSSVPLLPPLADGRAYANAPNEYRLPSVEAWLGSIATAKFVVTDSFHGAVFAILNNVPFLVVVNRDRGAARFETLLATFGLSDRMMEPGGLVDPTIVESSIDWPEVNAQISAERARSVSYLSTHLPRP